MNQEDMQTRRWLFDRIADRTGVAPGPACSVVTQFLKQLHRCQYERPDKETPLEMVYHDCDPAAFFHFVLFLQGASKEGAWEPGIASEYLARMGPIGHESWDEFSEELKDWKPYFD